MFSRIVISFCFILFSQNALGVIAGWEKLKMPNLPKQMDAEFIMQVNPRHKTVAVKLISKKPLVMVELIFDPPNHRVSVKTTNDDKFPSKTLALFVANKLDTWIDEPGNVIYVPPVNIVEGRIHGPIIGGFVQILEQIGSAISTGPEDYILHLGDKVTVLKQIQDPLWDLLLPDIRKDIEKFDSAH